MLSIVLLSDAPGQPKALLDLPGPLRIGDPIALRFGLRRQNGKRTEVLLVSGKFRVTAIGFDAQRYPRRQLLSVESVDKALVWTAVKKRPQEAPRRLGPAKSPRMPI